MCGIKCLKRRKKEYANWKMALLRGWKRKTWVNFRTCTTEAFRFERYSWLQLKGKIKAVFATKAGETICKEAKESNASMIVMGTRGDNPKSYFSNTCSFTYEYLCYFRNGHDASHDSWQRQWLRSASRTLPSHGVPPLISNSRSRSLPNVCCLIKSHNSVHFSCHSHITHNLLSM